MNQENFDVFGMGFAIDDDQMGETLYVAEITFGEDSLGLGTIDTQTLDLDFVGPFSETFGSAMELTSSDDGKLYGYNIDEFGAGGWVIQIDKATAQILEATFLPVGGDGALAFAQWGGDFYIFTAPGGGATTVTRYDPESGAVDEVATLNETVVGAGVSTCKTAARERAPGRAAAPILPADVSAQLGVRLASVAAALPAAAGVVAGVGAQAVTVHAGTQLGAVRADHLAALGVLCALGVGLVAAGGDEERSKAQEADGRDEVQTHRDRVPRAPPREKTAAHAGRREVSRCGSAAQPHGRSLSCEAPRYDHGASARTARRRTDGRRPAHPRRSPFRSAHRPATAPASR